MADPFLVAVQELVAASRLAQAEDLPDLLDRAAVACGCTDTDLFLVDYDQQILVPLSGSSGTTVDLEGTVGGRCFTAVETQISRSDGAVVVWVPLLNGTERLGAARFELPAASHEADGDGLEVGGELRTNLTLIASILAFVIESKSIVTDVLEQVRRTLPMTVPAEIQWRLLPPLTYATDDVVVSGVLLPTHEIAGDSFDYAVNGTTLHVALLDAMGHGLDATMQASVAIGALRNARHIGLSLLDTAHSVDGVLAHTFGRERFVTAIVGELDLTDGTWSWISAGHPPALLLRGRGVVKSLDGGGTTPLGLRLDRAREVARERLQPGDRLLLHSDGVIEARDGERQMFGVERLVEFVARQLADGRPAPETLRRLNHAILAHQDGLLQDDATTLVIEWRGPGAHHLLI